MASNVTFTPTKGNGIRCAIRSPQGRSLSLCGALTDIEPPTVDGHPRWFAIALWCTIFGPTASMRSSSGCCEIKKSAPVMRGRPRTHKKIAINIAKLIDLEGTTLRAAWCSACLTHGDHRKLKQGPAMSRPICAPRAGRRRWAARPSVPAHGIRDFGSLRIPRYCAEHRHDIPGFEKVDADSGRWKTTRLPDLRQEEPGAGFKGCHRRSRRWRRRHRRPSGGTGDRWRSRHVVVVGSYTGAAATSYGLALLGGGSLAAGGLGMAGGTASWQQGLSLGGGLGALVTTAYIGADKSFRIEKLADGTATPVIVASGFLTEGGDSWGPWQQIIQRRYPDSPVYRVHWGAKELAALGVLVGGGVGKVGMGFAVKTAAAKASRAAAKKLGPIGPMLVATDLLKNAWHTAKVRADRTGVALAGLMARTDADSYILVGHSLGARAMVTAAQTLATNPEGPKVATAHLLGAAIGAKGDWRSLNDAATDAVYNYYSTNDKVLKYLYAVVQAGSVPAGLRGFGSKFPKIKDRNVSRLVKSHSDYFDTVDLV